jgi:hypothetical protein
VGSGAWVGAEIFVREDGEVDFDAELSADVEQDFDRLECLIRVGGECIVDAGGGFPGQIAAVGVVFGNDLEGFLEVAAPRIGAALAGSGAGGGRRTGGEAGFEGDALADRGGEADEQRRRVGWLAGGGARWPGGGRLRRLGRWFRFGEVGAGADCGGAGEVHGEIDQFGADALMARGAFVGCFQRAGCDGVQLSGLRC